MSSSPGFEKEKEREGKERDSREEDVRNSNETEVCMQRSWALLFIPLFHILAFIDSFIALTFKLNICGVLTIV